MFMQTSPRIAVLIVAGGTGSRAFAEIPKQYHALAGVPVLLRTVKAFMAVPAISRIQAVIHPEHMEWYETICGDLAIAPPVHGGRTRQDSVHEGLKALKDFSPDYVLIHDAARPLVSKTLIESLLSRLSDEAVIPALPVKETLKRHERQEIKETIPRDGIVAVQTPQLFAYPKIMSAHDILQGKVPLGEEKTPLCFIKC